MLFRLLRERERERARARGRAREKLQNLLPLFCWFFSRIFLFIRCGISYLFVGVVLMMCFIVFFFHVGVKTNPKTESELPVPGLISNARFPPKPPLNQPRCGRGFRHSTVTLPPWDASIKRNTSISNPPWSQGLHQKPPLGRPCQEPEPRPSWSALTRREHTLTLLDPSQQH